MSLSRAQLVPLPRLSQTIRFFSDLNIRWRLLNPSNYIFYNFLKRSKTPLNQGASPIIRRHASHGNSYIQQLMVVIACMNIGG
jgi:hypothetical protein